MTAARVLAAVAAAIALVGCGGGDRLSKTGYEQKLQKAGRELLTARNELARAIPKNDFEDGVDAVENALNDAADELDGITPPKDVQGPNGRLVDAFRLLADEFEQLKAAAETSPDAARQKGREVTTGPASREADHAIKEIKRRGYDVGQLGS